MGWQEVAKALRAYEPKALGLGSYVSPNGTCCAVGALLPDVAAVLELGYSPRHVASERYGLSVEWLSDLIRENDRRVSDDKDDFEPPSDRYVRVLSWVEDMASREGAA